MLVDVRCNYKIYLFTENVEPGICELKYDIVIFVKVYLAINLIFQRNSFPYHVFLLSIKNVETKFILCFSMYPYDGYPSALQC